jgi:hypothetical protein
LMGPSTPPSMGPSGGEGAVGAGLDPFALVRTLAPLRYVGVRPIDSEPVDGPPSSAHSGRKSGGRTIRPALRARIPETHPAAAPPCSNWPRRFAAVRACDDAPLHRHRASASGWASSRRPRAPSWTLRSFRPWPTRAGTRVGGAPGRIWLLAPSAGPSDYLWTTPGGRRFHGKPGTGDKPGSASRSG